MPLITVTEIPVGEGSLGPHFTFFLPYVTSRRHPNVLTRSSILQPLFRGLHVLLRVVSLLIMCHSGNACTLSSVDSDSVDFSILCLHPYRLLASVFPFGHVSSSWQRLFVSLLRISRFAKRVSL
jgi:hypothetical protein